MEKLARVCWNTEGWRRPSGNYGKTVIGSSYKSDLGFGYDEWLLDDSKIVNDYHYGFLQAMTLGRHKHKVYDIHIFAISPNMERLYLGCLKNAVGVSMRESEDIFNIYGKNGWIDEMEEDVANVCGRLGKWQKDKLFNVKFRFDDAVIYHSNPKLLVSDCIGHRYNLMNLKSELKFITDENGNVLTLDTRHIVNYDREGKIIEDPIYRKMLKIVSNLLEHQYTYIDKNKAATISVDYKTDIIGYDAKSKESHYYIIKTGSAKNSIREALGLILELAHYPSEDRADKLFVIAPERPDKADKEYLAKLRIQYHIPIWFRWYSFWENKLYDAV